MPIGYLHRARSSLLPSLKSLFHDALLSFCVRVRSSCCKAVLERAGYWVITTYRDLRKWNLETDFLRINDTLGSTPVGTLPPLESIVGLPDFDWAARHKLNASSYTYYRNGAAGEWSYRNNLEVFQRFRLRPRGMRLLSVHISRSHANQVYSNGRYHQD